MPLPKKTAKTEAQPDKPDQQAAAGRKPWVKKSPVEVVFEQAEKLRAEIAKDEEALNAKRRQLEKFEAAKRLFVET